MVLKLDRAEQSALAEFKDLLVGRFGDKLRLIKLFGSKARGDFDQYSDIDMLVVTKERDRQLAREIHGVAVDVLLKHGVYLSVKVFDEKSFRHLNWLGTAFMRNLKKEGINLWQAGSNKELGKKWCARKKN